MNRDARIDAYIARSAPFAQPILTHVRALVHASCPEVEETIKWQMPSFTYKGKPLCGMAAFKAHCTFGFWNGTLVMAQSDDKSAEAMGQLGRITSLKDFPASRAMKAYVKTAARLIDEGVGRPLPARRKKAALRLPAELKLALADNAGASATFEALSPSHKREYIEWITEARTAPTRARRIETTVQWLEEGKHRNWKYAR